MLRLVKMASLLCFFAGAAILFWGWWKMPFTGEEKASSIYDHRMQFSDEEFKERYDMSKADFREEFVSAQAERRSAEQKSELLMYLGAGLLITSSCFFLGQGSKRGRS